MRFQNANEGIPLIKNCVIGYMCLYRGNFILTLELCQCNYLLIYLA